MHAYEKSELVKRSANQVLDESNDTDTQSDDESSRAVFEDQNRSSK